MAKDALNQPGCDGPMTLWISFWTQHYTTLLHVTHKIQTYIALDTNTDQMLHAFCQHCIISTPQHANCSNVKMWHQYTNIQQMRLVSVLQNDVLIKVHEYHLSSTCGYWNCIIYKYLCKTSFKKHIRKNTPSDNSVTIRKYTTALNTYTLVYYT